MAEQNDTAVAAFNLSDPGEIGDAPVAVAQGGDAIGGNLEVHVLSSFEFWLSIVLLIFGLIVIGVQLYLATRRGPDGTHTVSVENGIRLSIVSLIIISALVLIASGYSNNQIAPAMGLFGTIAGYLVGKQDKVG